MIRGVYDALSGVRMVGAAAGMAAFACSCLLVEASAEEVCACACACACACVGADAAGTRAITVGVPKAAPTCATAHLFKWVSVSAAATSLKSIKSKKKKRC